MALTKEQKKIKQNKLLQQLSALQDHLQALPESNERTEALSLCASMKLQCKAYSEILRLSESIVRYKLNEDQDYFFKGILSKELYKIYV